MKLIKLFALLLIPVIMLSACNKKMSYMKSFHKELKRDMDDVTIKYKKDTVRVIYPELAMFDFGKDEIKAGAKPSLERFAKLLAKYDRINIQINGYTDNIGTDAVNDVLSQGRADNAKALFNGSGVAASRMNTEGRGASNPIMKNSSEEGRQANRRVEFLLYDGNPDTK